MITILVSTHWCPDYNKTLGADSPQSYWSRSPAKYTYVIDDTYTGKSAWAFNRDGGYSSTADTLADASRFLKFYFDMVP